MTATAVPFTEPAPTPVSQRVESLQAVLADPALAGWHEEARAELQRLTDAHTLAA